MLMMTFCCFDYVSKSPVSAHLRPILFLKSKVATVSVDEGRKVRVCVRAVEIRNTRVL